MTIRYSFLLTAALSGVLVVAQKKTGDPSVAPHFDLRPDLTGQMEFLGETQPLRDYVADPNRPVVITRTEEEEDERRGPDFIRKRGDRHALPLGEDPVWQKSGGGRSAHALDITQDGFANTGVSPGDPCLDVGPNHVIIMVNQGSGSFFRIYNKSGTQLLGNTDFDAYMGTSAGSGDPIVLYDSQADRWLMTEFGLSGNHLIIAVSSTADPMGTWYKYNFTTPQFPDYPKYAVWGNMYVVTSNESTDAIYALDRTKMLAGLALTTFQRFTAPHYGTISFQAVTPVTLDNGTAPPAGAQAMFMRHADDAWSGVGAGNDRLEMWKMTVDFTTPANSVVSGPTYFPVQAFDSSVGGYVNFSGVTQQGSTNTLDPIREVLMNRVQYRNMGTHEAIVCSHVVDVGSDRAGVRWYEMRRTGGIANPWSIYQQGTYAPTDGLNRWISGVAINAAGDIGMSFNVAGPTAYPSIRYTGRYASDPLGQMTISETTVVAGATAQPSAGGTRWGDYGSLDSDPVDGSFWGIQCYMPTSSWRTRMYKFSFTPQNINISPKVFLEGPYVQAVGLMQDSLRVKGLIPLAQPFTALGYTHVGGGSEVTTAPVLAVSGNNAIVDWVLVELRNSATPSTIVASKSALVQRDGDVVGTDGVSPVSFSIGAGNYFVAVRHRNHLGAMTASAQALTSVPVTVNFTTLALATFGANALKDISGTQVLWTGDATFNKTLAYVGIGNDRDPILTRVGGTTPNNVVAGYYAEDTNMDGSVSYIGIGNDRDVILVNVGSTTPNNTRTEQVP
jgi:hypothetical protein